MAVSFSAAAKAEACRILPNKHCCALAECFGILLYCNSFQLDGIKIITESREFAYILPKLFKKAFGLGFDLQNEGQGSPVWSRKQMLFPGFTYRIASQLPLSARLYVIIPQSR